MLVLMLVATPYERYLWMAVPVLVLQGWLYRSSLNARTNRLKMNLLTVSAVGSFALAAAVSLAGFVLASH